MISVFILEDNQYKLEDICTVLKNKFKDNIKIDSCSYFDEGFANLINGNYNYAILDNNVFRFRDSWEFCSNCAEDILAGLELRGDDVKCIICSSDDVKLEYDYDNLLDVIKYSSISIGWADKLINLIK